MPYSCPTCRGRTTSPISFLESIADDVYDFCLLPDPDVGPSVLVCDVEHTSFHFGVCGRKFVPCLFGQCPGAVFMSRS